MIKRIFNKLFGDNHDVEISFKQGFDLTDLPVITLYQGVKKFNFLLDTGSNNSVIDSNILSEIEYETVDCKSNIFGLEGEKKEAEVCNITLAYKDVKYEYLYVVCDMKTAFDNIKKDTGVTLHGIIGSKFFNKYRYVLDFAELIAYSKK